MSNALDDLWDRKKAEKAALRPAATPTIPTTQGDAENAIVGALRWLGQAQEGQRNDWLNRAAGMLGSFVATGYLTRPEAEQRLEEVALQIGLEPGEIADTMRSGLEYGLTRPEHPRARHVERPMLVDHATGEILDSPEPQPLNLIEERFPAIDWVKLFNEPDEPMEWIAEPLIPARRLVALYSSPKVGKSLLMLEVAACVATGRPLFGYDVQQRRVLYIDFENDPKRDIRRRLLSMRFKAEDLDELKYLSFPKLEALDTPTGAAEMLAAVDYYQPELVVIDTVSRAVRGDENENDTWLNFYRFVGLGLKRREVALVRLDHAGKDTTKGQRGGSAKGGDVDAVWRMSNAGPESVHLVCEMNRFPLAETSLLLDRSEGPLTHKAAGDAQMALHDRVMADALTRMDQLGLPPGTGYGKAREALNGDGFDISKRWLEEALRRRKASSGTHTPLIPDLPTGKFE